MDHDLFFLLHTFSAFWLRSSVVSVLLSLISEIWDIFPNRLIRKISEAISAASKTRETLPAQSARRGRAAGERRPKERPKAARASKGVSDRIGLLFECSCSSCRSCLASPPGACPLALAVLAALASLAFLGVLAALQPHALPVPR